ncbi:uncharacterized protein BHQ10_004300 [Talaromyces amestolkiae]|uniref:NADH-cytochrome b5 reductase n=1 Tax=Talaromyces amestolkiae TaxID=1196081 RepID=A0A364KXL0_TALAM|nr:uncharacterized protein BHQ10_004300 [Talaromyces amestolkiae]RAO68288.1 hypothetical protein BHQ10_004300 [Talaromyces amestolkiae]
MRPSNAWLPVLRPYTPISDLSEPGFIDLLVKKYPGGKASSHLHSLQPGEALTFVVPLKGYAWTPNRHSHIYLLAGGAGITPMYQLIQGVLKNPEDRTKVTLVFGVNSKEDVVLREELDAFESQYPDRFKVVYTISSNNTATEGESHHFKQGRITESLLRSVMKSDEEGVKVFVSGPPAMEAALMGSNGWGNSGAGGILGKLGYTKDQIYKF